MKIHSFCKQSVSLTIIRSSRPGTVIYAIPPDEPYPDGYISATAPKIAPFVSLLSNWAECAAPLKLSSSSSSSSFIVFCNKKSGALSIGPEQEGPNGPTLTIQSTGRNERTMVIFLSSAVNVTFRIERWDDLPLLIT